MRDSQSELTQFTEPHYEVWRSPTAAMPDACTAIRRPAPTRMAAASCRPRLLSTLSINSPMPAFSCFAFSGGEPLLREHWHEPVGLSVLAAGGGDRLLFADSEVRPSAAGCRSHKPSRQCC